MQPTIPETKRLLQEIRDGPISIVTCSKSEWAQELEVTESSLYRTADDFGVQFAVANRRGAPVTSLPCTLTYWSRTRDAHGTAIHEPRAYRARRDSEEHPDLCIGFENGIETLRSHVSFDIDKFHEEN